uniref:Phospholipid/glycerol acyltransferase domain-containing protein n=1 Tax=Plectus sambesii TaxID=2011161 RepID=A0A914XC20_9BILA
MQTPTKGCLKDVNIFTRCRGIFFGFVLLLCSLYGCYIIMLFLPFLIFNHHRLWRVSVDRGIGFWLLLPISLMDFLFGTKFSVMGDPIVATEPALIIMNHRTRLDWMHFWSALYKINPWLLTTEKITLKAQLQNLPGAGWAMAANAFIFLQRSRETDSERLAEAIDYYSDLNMNYQLLFFPEGTDKSPGTTERSNAYAKKNGLKPYEYLIHPRTAGFVYLLNKMRRTNYIKCIYDVTIAFPERIVQSELELGLTGVAPQSVHFDIHRIDIADVPKEEDAVCNWLNKLWRQKEEKLRAFYQKPVGKRSFTPRGTDIVWPVS